MCNRRKIYIARVFLFWGFCWGVNDRGEDGGEGRREDRVRGCHTTDWIRHEDEMRIQCPSAVRSAAQKEPSRTPWSGSYFIPLVVL